ncbi:MAG: tyrosine--tRNA ligase [Actinobacteria bacterium]|nr:tyrosine--tRNA ligase [Actinomycetota bacterium]
MVRSCAVTPEEQLPILTAGTVDVISEGELVDRLAAGRPLRVKLGIDPTASDIHLGFAVVLRKLRAFQDLGHIAVLIIGDFTAQVGDPSGKSATRPQLTKEEVDGHALTYLEQVRGILLDERLEVRRNSEWLGAMGIEDVLRLSSRATVAQMLERDDFSKRYESGQPISVMEFLYPLLQGWDSVMVEADVELGGTDQLFNLLVGRQLQRDEGQASQVVMTTPLLEGLDGVQKMSKSLGNYVGIAEEPGEMFGKLMSLPDALMPRYFALTTGWRPDEVTATTEQLASGELHPGQAKRLLARTVVDLYHGAGAGEAAEGEFDRVFRDHAPPADIPEIVLGDAVLVEGKVWLPRLLAAAGLVPSNKEGRRKIEQGGVRIDGTVVTEADREFDPGELDGTLVQVGRRAWVRVVVRG